MKTYAEIQNNIVVNVSIWEDEPPNSNQLVDITDIENCGIGWLYVEGQLVEPVMAEPIIEPNIEPNIEPSQPLE
jgi:hypothetical protein